MAQTGKSGISRVLCLRTRKFDEKAHVTLNRLWRLPGSANLNCFGLSAFESFTPAE